MEKILVLGKRIDIALKAESIQKIVEYLANIPLHDKDSIIQDLNELIVIHRKNETEKQTIEAKKKDDQKFVCEIEKISLSLLKLNHDEPDHYHRNWENIRWQKTVIGVNKKTENGFSIVGDFVKSPTRLKMGDLVLNCVNKGKSTGYQLIKIDSAINAHEIAWITEEKWAIQLWDSITQNLAKN